MASPIPYGLHVISGELTDKDTDRITSVIHRFLTYKEAAQLENLKQVYDLPDGGYFIIQHAGGLFRVIADKQKQKIFNFINDGLVKAFIPMFFSGIIEKSTVRENEKVKIKITEQCRRRLENQLDRKVAKELQLGRFTIEQSYLFPEFVMQRESVFKRTQYFAHNQSWYSGSMAKLHQFVGGYGIQNVDSLPDDEIERIQMQLPEKLLSEFEEKYRDVRLPGYAGLPHEQGEFQYDYKWSRTHGVTFDSEGKPWLIQVTSKVYAMPLPVIPITANPQFHQYVREVLGDSELIEVLETFGAFPSGETFPKNNEEFRQWVRAGTIIEVCDTADFTSHTAMFTACGWSFNNKGRAAYNTGWKYDAKGLIECSTFKLNLNLQATSDHYGTDKVDLGENLDLDQKLKMMTYLSALFASLRVDSNMGRAIRYKIRRIDTSEILARSTNISRDMSSEINYWDTYVCKPIANHSGKVIKLYTGKLFHHAKKIAQPQIKFPDFFMGMCISFDFTPLEKGVSADCDTIMYVYFDDDVLKVIKYFYSTKTFKREIDSNFESCMTVGSWYKDETIGQSSIVGNFYTTDIDDRDEVSVSTIETTVKGSDKGYDTNPFFSFTAFFSRIGDMWRNRYFTHLTKTKQVNGRNIELSVLVPMYNRNTVLYAKKVTGETVRNSESLELLSVRDPYSYRYWTYHPVFAWIYSLPKETGVPAPTKGNPVWVELEDYQPSACSDFADQGSWVPGLPADYGWLIHPNSNEWMHSGGGGPPKVKEYHKSTTTPIETTGDLKWMVGDRIIAINMNIPDKKYFLPSPDDYGDGMYRASSQVFFGQAIYANISESKDINSWQFHGHTSLVGLHNRVCHFIGVVNE